MLSGDMYERIRYRMADTHSPGYGTSPLFEPESYGRREPVLPAIVAFGLSSLSPFEMLCRLPAVPVNTLKMVSK